MSDGDDGRSGTGAPRFLLEPTDALVERQRRVLDRHGDRFEAAKELVRHLGARWRSEDVDVDGPEVFDYHHPTEGTVLYYGYRLAPDGSEAVLFLANMEGIEATETPTNLPIEGLPSDGWELTLASPGVGTANADEPVALENGGVVGTSLVRTPEPRAGMESRGRPGLTISSARLSTATDTVWSHTRTFKYRNGTTPCRDLSVAARWPAGARHDTARPGAACRLSAPYGERVVERPSFVEPVPRNYIRR